MQIKNRLRYSSWFAITLMSVIACLLIVKMTALHPAFKQGLDKLIIPLMLLRWGFYLIIFFNWKYLMGKAALRYQWDSNVLSDAISQRSRLICWVVIFELIVGQNVFGKLIHFIFYNFS